MTALRTYWKTLASRQPLAFRLISSALTGAIALWTCAGCATTSEDLAAHLADHSLRQEHVLEVIGGQAALYRSCLTERGGACRGGAGEPLPGATGQAPSPVHPAPSPSLTASVGQLPAGHPARSAAKALEQPSLAQVAGFYNELRGSAPGPTGASAQRDGQPRTVKLDLSLSEIQDLQDRIGRATADGGWRALREHAEEQLSRVPTGSTEHDDLARDHRQLLYVEKYLEAYFRNGRFVAVDLTIPAEEAQRKLAQELARHAAGSCRLYDEVEHSRPTAAGAGSGAGGDSSGGECDGLAQRLYRTVRGSAAGVDRQLIKLSQTGFVSRDGSFSAQMPAFEVTANPLAPHLLSLTTDQGSSVQTLDFTTIGTDLVRITLEAIFDAHEGLPAVSTATARQLGKASLPLFDPPMDHVDTDDFNAMTALSQRSATAVGVTLDRVVPGLGPFSLNNPALEQLIVTLITTSVREAVAKASWCWYACDLDTELQKTEAKLKAKLQSGEQTLENKAQAGLRHELERVELALRLRP
jgi:hypothetical protein